LAERKAAARHFLKKPDLAIHVREHLTCELIFDAACLSLQVNDVIEQVKHMFFLANYGAVLLSL